MVGRTGFEPVTSTMTACLAMPVYTGKAMAGMIRRAEAAKGNEERHVMFIHTGGQPPLFAYQDDLTRAFSIPQSPRNH